LQRLRSLSNFLLVKCVAKRLTLVTDGQWIVKISGHDESRLKEVWYDSWNNIPCYKIISFGNGPCEA